MTKNTVATGGCMCGAVRFETNAAPLDIAYCHCSDCRGFTGAPVVTWVIFDADNVNFVRGNRKTFESSPGIHWGFCDSCGSSLTWEAKSKRYDAKPIVELHIGAFDDPGPYFPDRHWMEFERLPWFDVADDLPRYEKLDIDAAPTHTGPRNKAWFRA